MKVIDVNYHFDSNKTNWRPTFKTNVSLYKKVGI